MSNTTLYQGDCLEEMKKLPDNSVDSVVTDPPYGLLFMGQNWDHGVPGEGYWKEALRVAKPGAHLLAFGGTRTYHRLACAIEDAGWEIRDCCMWVHSQGFPKGQNVSKQVEALLKTSKTNETEAAKAWKGWNTQLKPALEPIVVARKPLEGTVAANVLKYGTGAINIDGCRVPTFSMGPGTTPKSSVAGRRNSMAGAMDRIEYDNSKGRWPANLIHDGSDEVLALFPESKGQCGAVKGTEPSGITNGIYGQFAERHSAAPRGDSGSAARFFYCAKASRSERGDFNDHTTVKPVALMRYLVRLVTRKGGLVLDPFMGSGTTGVAALEEGCGFVGVEKDNHYYEIAQRRIEAATERGVQLELF